MLSIMIRSNNVPQEEPSSGSLGQAGRQGWRQDTDEEHVCEGAHRVRVQGRQGWWPGPRREAESKAQNRDRPPGSGGPVVEVQVGEDPEVIVARRSWISSTG